jgi:hypothetical protein
MGQLTYLVGIVSSTDITLLLQHCFLHANPHTHTHTSLPLLLPGQLSLVRECKRAVRWRWYFTVINVFPKNISWFVKKFRILQEARCLCSSLFLCLEWRCSVVTYGMHTALQSIIHFNFTQYYIPCSVCFLFLFLNTFFSPCLSSCLFSFHHSLISHVFSFSFLSSISLPSFLSYFLSLFSTCSFLYRKFVSFHANGWRFSISYLPFP